MERVYRSVFKYWQIWIVSYYEKLYPILAGLLFRAKTSCQKIKRQLSHELNSNRQPSKRLIFNRQPSKGSPIETLLVSTVVFV